MADLSRNAADLPIVLIGATTGGVATTPVGSDTNGNLLVKEFSNGTTGSAVPATALQVAGTDGTNLRAISTDTTGKVNVNNISGTVSLPTGAATSANQTTEITSLQLIDNPVGSVTAGTAGTNSFLTGGVFNTALPTVTNGQQVATQLDSSGRLILSPLANTSFVKAQLQDNSGNGIASNNSQLQVRDVLNTSGQYRAQSVTTSAAEALGGGTILANRKFLSITPTNGQVYWGFNSSVTSTNGTPIFKNQTFTLSVTDNVHVFVIATTTVDCRIAEGS